MVVYVYIKIKWFKEDFLKIAEIMSYDYQPVGIKVTENFNLFNSQNGGLIESKTFQQEMICVPKNFHFISSKLELSEKFKIICQYVYLV